MTGEVETLVWSSMGNTGTIRLDLLYDDELMGVIAEGLPPGQTTFDWTVGQLLSGEFHSGEEFKVRVTAENAEPMAETVYYFYEAGGKLLAEYDGTGNCIRDYLYLGGKMIAEYQPQENKYFYFASDQINSTRLVTDGNGNVVHSAQYDPFGGLYKTWTSAYTPKPGFSGKEREEGTALDYFGARYYAHAQYRFTSVDPIIGRDEAIENPQLWNLYAYCRNNPITFLDPDGNDYKRMIEQSWTSKLYCQWIDQAPIVSFLKGDFSEGIDKLGANLKAQLDDPSFWAGFIGGIKFIGSEGLTVASLLNQCDFSLTSKGAKQAFIKGDIESIFNQITKGGEKLETGVFFKDGAYITQHVGTKNGLKTIDINVNEIEHKIRVVE